MTEPATADCSELECRLRSEYKVVTEPICCADRQFNVLRPRSAEELIDEQEFNIDERIPYWAEVWPSARVLAKQLTQKGAGGERQLLELGCGCGFVALVAAHLGYEVTATDYYQPACDFVRLNSLRHELPRIHARMVNWRNLPHDLGRFDVVVAADVLYERDYCELISRVIAATLESSGIAIVTDPERDRASSFLACCAEVGLAGELVGRTPYNDGVNRPFVDTYEICWK